MSSARRSRLRRAAGKRHRSTGFTDEQIVNLAAQVEAITSDPSPRRGKALARLKLRDEFGLSALDVRDARQRLRQRTDQKEQQ